MEQIRRILPAFVVAALLAGLFALSGARPALAHTRVPIGPYVVVVGWLNEPVIAGERNAVTIEVLKDDQPVKDVEGTLDFALEYAGRTFHGNITPTDQPGLYRADVFPTVRGQYVVHLTGAIGDTQVDEQIKPEEVMGGDAIQFPEVEPDPRQMNQTLADVQSRLNTAYALAIGGLVVGVVGVGLGVFGLMRRR
jgi:hypothetical protein